MNVIPLLPEIAGTLRLLGIAAWMVAESRL
jgi:hypothetical protein